MRCALVDIVKNRGVRGLYAGLTPTLIEIVPYAGLQFGTYDTFKRWSMVTPESLFLEHPFLVNASCSESARPLVSFSGFFFGRGRGVGCRRLFMKFFPVVGGCHL